MEQDAVKVAPGFYKLLLENDRVRVLGFQGKPGDKLAMHSHPDIVAYITTAGSATFTLADGTSQDMDVKAGEAVFMEGHSHSVEIKGSSEISGVLVELKS